MNTQSTDPAQTIRSVKEFKIKTTTFEDGSSKIDIWGEAYSDFEIVGILKVLSNSIESKFKQISHDHA